MKLRKQWLIKAALFAMPAIAGAQQEKKGIPDMRDIIKANHNSYYGMFNLYVQEGRYLAEIPDRLLGRDILTSITIIKGSAQRQRNPAQRFGFAGDAMNDRVIRFRKAGGDRIEITTPVFSQATDSTNLYYHVWKSGLLPAYLSFDIKAHTDSSSLIDLTDLLDDDNDLISLNGAKDDLKLGSFEPEKSKIIGVNAFENNLVFRTQKSYGAASNTGAASPGEEASSAPQKKQPPHSTRWEIGASWYLLPETPMTPRLADKRVGYFTTVQKNYDKNPNEVAMVAVANRWRIEPRKEDIPKYLRGELVEPQKPIVFYVDRNMPSYLIPYVIKGVNAWQSSFEKIGFKNAILARLAPTPAEDSLYSMEDARYSYISYKPSEMANAYGPQLVDPRSGEILSSHIAVFHNILELLQRWYFSMCSATDTAARNLPMNKALAGKMLQNVITHEVGHTIGLRHDFAGSNSYDIDSIRNPAYVRQHGFGPSVMDYMRFNYVAQPGDGMTQDDLFPRIGVYDDYAIAWGYRYNTTPTNPYQESKELEQWVSEQRKDHRCFYLDESTIGDPRVQSEDVGNNSMKASRLGIANLKRTMQHLEEWADNTTEDDYATLRSMYRAVEGRYYTYLGHVLKNIGGDSIDVALRAEQKDNFIPVSKALQQEAVNYICEFMLKEPTWMYPADILTKTRFNFARDVAGPYDDLMGRLLSRYYFINRNNAVAGSADYQPKQFLQQLYTTIFGNIRNGQPISQYDRFIQSSFTNKLLTHAGSRAVPDPINRELIKMLENASAAARAGAAINKDHLSAAHLRGLADLIEMWKTGTRKAYQK
ncbi:zinc-dependent metalloprotease [Filimonas effusa]|uniref:DUF5117 domain-containing protein n=1 Tax=Filimonas effusa TaxID=2508721 RepID=A0A4Q1DCI2_9BACT|nr:zinc-dependent metalloprotease [Filimonas effusa]RXK87070.1 DUF5117 domain-containing protein [Filimonas effusa]